MTKATILVATWSDGLFAFEGEVRREEIAKVAVRGLAPDGRGGALAIAGGHSLQRRTASGEWTTIARSEYDLSCSMAARDTIYAGTDDARMLRVSQDGGGFDSLEGFERVAGRETWFAGSAIVNGRRMGPPLGIRSVSANSDGSILFANVHVGGIPRSSDGGKTWQPTIDIHSDVHEVRGHLTDPDLIAAASAAGLCISRDGGATWSIESEGLHATHCSAVAFSGDDILVSASTDPFAAQGKVYRRPIRPEGRIMALEGGFPVWTRQRADTGCIATKDSLIVVVDGAGTLYASSDFGRSWTCGGGQFPSPSSVLIC